MESVQQHLKIRSKYFRFPCFCLLHRSETFASETLRSLWIRSRGASVCRLWSFTSAGTETTETLRLCELHTNRLLPKPRFYEPLHECFYEIKNLPLISFVSYLKSDIQRQSSFNYLNCLWSAPTTEWTSLSIVPIYFKLDKTKTTSLSVLLTVPQCALTQSKKKSGSTNAIQISKPRF